MKIYNELKSLGFLEWLNDIKFGCSHTNIMLLDVQPIDSIERSGYNAIAFRWFREKYKLSAIVSQFGYAIENEYGQIIYTISEDEYPLKLMKKQNLNVLRN